MVSMPENKFDIELPQAIIESLARFIVAEMRKEFVKQQEQDEKSEEYKKRESSLKP